MATPEGNCFPHLRTWSVKLSTKQESRAVEFCVEFARETANAVLDHDITNQREGRPTTALPTLKDTHGSRRYRFLSSP